MNKLNLSLEDIKAGDLLLCTYTDECFIAGETYIVYSIYGHLVLMCKNSHNLIGKPDHKITDKTLENFILIRHKDTPAPSKDNLDNWV